jgi:anti-sigma factor RsiW
MVNSEGEEIETVAREGNLRHLTSEQIQEFLDERLSPEEEAPIQEHLSACPHCLAEVEAWNLVFSDLGSLEELEPSPAFSKEILSQLPDPAPWGARLRGWFGAGAARGAQVGHFPVEDLQDYLEGTVSAPRAARVTAHLSACEPCRIERKGWERLFGALTSLGRFAPAPGFAQRVMAGVRIPSPVPAPWVRAGNRVLGTVRGFLPQTRRGWAIVGGIASAPTISMAALGYLLFSRPLFTVGNVTTYLSWKASALFSSLFSSVASAMLDSVALFRAYSLLGTLAESPLLIGVGSLVFSLMSAAALWVLYRNLVATPSAERRYARARV